MILFRANWRAAGLGLVLASVVTLAQAQSSRQTNSPSGSWGRQQYPSQSNTRNLQRDFQTHDSRSGGGDPRGLSNDSRHHARPAASQHNTSGSAENNSHTQTGDSPSNSGHSNGKSEEGSTHSDSTSARSSSTKLGAESTGRSHDAPSEPTKSRAPSSDPNSQHPTNTRIGPADSSASSVKLVAKSLPNGGEVKTTPGGQVREKSEKKEDGRHTQQFAATGRVQREVIEKKDGSQETIHYAANGQVQRTVLTRSDGARETTNVHYDRSGKERATETIRVDTHGREVSKTVVVKQTTVIVKNTTIVNNTTIVRNYDLARYGFVYHPIYVVHSPVFVSWYDPYWYTPAGVLIVHPFHFAWGWNDYGWYRYHRHYWATYEVYPAPSYWMTDWLIAGYVAEQYAAAASAEQAREEARLARQDAENARAAAERARQDGEIAEARAAQREAEARAERAEARIARIEAEEARAKAQGDAPNPNATSIDPQTKETLRLQIEQAVAEKKAFAEQSAQGRNPILPDVSKALADPKHIYPVSSSITVVSAKDQSPAGTLTEGDLLRLEPGQEELLKDANENTFVTMRVMTSKGEEGEVKAGTLVNISLKSLQDFDSEFRAKLDLGLAEADKNKEQFKAGSS